jgi:NNP family nitrate/nitrite transporter-like MFS transporter
MKLRDFRHAGHTPTLFAAFLYFDISFMVWVLLGALANSIAADFHLAPAQKGFLTAIAVLGGACLRIPVGLMADRIGARRTAIIGLCVTFVPLLLGWLWVDSYATMLPVGLLLGVAGASFAAALPLASRWYPPQYQGLAMGIAGAGNSGTVLAAFFAPRIAQAWGWHAVFGLAVLPIFLTLLVVILLAKDSPTQPAPQPLSAYAAVFRLRDTWWFCFFYAITFGGFVGLASFLNTYFHDQYGLTAAQAGSYAAVCVFSGSLLRPVGGFLADHFGGLRVLTLLYVGAGLMLLGLSTTPSLNTATMLMFVGMGMLGTANGSVFQLVPQRFAKQIGIITGVVGAAGGFGGFVLPTLLGAAKQYTGSFATGLLGFGFVAFAGALGVLFVGAHWERAFLGKGGRAATHEPAAAPVELPLELEAPVIR